MVEGWRKPTQQKSLVHDMSALDAAQVGMNECLNVVTTISRLGKWRTALMLEIGDWSIWSGRAEFALLASQRLSATDLAI